MQDNERIARLESHVEHIQSDVTDLKTQVHKLSEVISDLTTRMETRFAKLDASRALDKVWWLLSMASLLAVMARGFKWI